jgi:3-oxo-5-alpha-steroid 4-dehydrogenase 1
MNEAELHFYLVLALFGLSLPVLLFLLRITAPYGRYSRGGFGPSIPSRLAWIVMESPTVLLFAAVYLAGSFRFETVPLVLCAFFQIHYVHRTFVFPFRMRTKGKRVPLSIPLAGALFNVVNAYINARWISHFGTYAGAWLADPRFVAGALLFALGLSINLHADTVLIHLRKPGESGYKIPRGGMYRWISSPNYFGEIVEWIGWALMTWSLAGLAFAVWTIANLAPRALSNHTWYREKFADYPRERRALIPYVL